MRDGLVPVNPKPTSFGLGHVHTFVVGGKKILLTANATLAKNPAVKATGLKHVDELGVKDVKAIIDDFWAENDFWKAGEYPPGSVIPTLTITSKLLDYHQFLKFLMLLGDAGLYWSHDVSTKTIIIAGPTKEAVAQYMQGIINGAEDRNAIVTWE